MDRNYLNKLRRMAGVPEDFSAEKQIDENLGIQYTNLGGTTSNPDNHTLPQSPDMKIKLKGYENEEEYHDDHDDEHHPDGDMARRQLKNIHRNATELCALIDDHDDFPAWVASKLTKAEDYLDIVADYLKGELKEADTSHKFKKGDHVMYKGEKVVVVVPDAKADFVGVVPVGHEEDKDSVDLVRAGELKMIEEKAEPNKAQLFADTVFNRRGFWTKLFMKDRAMNKRAATEKLEKAGFSQSEIAKLRSWLKKATENVAGKENIFMVKMPDNFSGWGFTLGRGKEAEDAGMREIGSMADEEAFNRKVHQEFLRLAKEHKLTEATQAELHDLVRVDNKDGISGPLYRKTNEGMTPSLKPAEYKAYKAGEVTPEELAKKHKCSVGQIKGELNQHADHERSGRYEKVYGEVMEGKTQYTPVMKKAIQDAGGNPDTTKITFVGKREMDDIKGNLEGKVKLTKLNGVKNAWFRDDHGGHVYKITEGILSEIGSISMDDAKKDLAARNKKKGMDPDLNDCPSCEGKGKVNSVECKRCKGRGKIEESAHYHTDGHYADTFQDAKSHKQPINVPSPYETTATAPEWDEEEEDYEMANDTEKVTVPAKVLGDLKKVIDGCKAEAEKAHRRDQDERKHYYEDTAEALQIVHDHLALKTVEGLKRAQLYSQRMANVSRHLIPDHVWKFLVDGGVKRSLKDYHNEVKGYPVVGPRNTLDDNK